MMRKPTVSSDSAPRDRVSQDSTLPPRPMPAPADAGGAKDEQKIPRHEDPTRYGDWEIGGRCIDF